MRACHRFKIDSKGVPSLLLQEHRLLTKRSASGKQGAFSAGGLLVQMDIVWVRNDSKYMRHAQKIIGSTNTYAAV